MTNFVAATAIAASLKRDNLVVGVEDERDYNYPEVGVQRPLEQRSNNRMSSLSRCGAGCSLSTVLWALPGIKLLP